MGMGLREFVAPVAMSGGPCIRRPAWREAGARALLLVAVLAVSSWSAAQAAGRAGLRPPTAQERQWDAAHLVRTRSVGPNSLALRRSGGTGRARGLPAAVDNSLSPLTPRSAPRGRSAPASDPRSPTTR